MRRTNAALAIALLFCVTLTTVTPVSALTGAETVELPDGSTASTHGIDDLRMVIRESTPTQATAGPHSIVCAGAKQPRVQALIAYPVDGVDRGTPLTPLVQQAIERVGEKLRKETEGRTSTVRLSVPVACTASGRVAVEVVRLPTMAADAHVWSIVRDLHRAGYRDRSTKYVVFYDDCIRRWGGCFSGGQGTLALDDRPGKQNRNNRGPDWAIDYGGGDDPQPNWGIMFHELMHTMGAVQLSAPHSTGAGHCNDGDDMMCYDDGGPNAAYDRTVCLLTVLDCGHDDYFDPLDPPTSRYLREHWNVGGTANQFLVRSPA